jgi:NAD-dependent deacetylase
MINYLKKIFNTKSEKIEQEDKPKLLIFSGAGLSADSGLATYRDNHQKSLWNTYDANVYSNFNNWYENKEKLFDFWNQRKKEMLNAQPNIAHFGLANLQKKYPNQVYIATQNIDLLLEKAGAQDVLHVHGKIDEMMCMKCNHTWYVGSTPFNNKEVCSHCKSDMIKPKIVLFGEQAPLYNTLYSMFDFRKRTENDIILCIGTSFKVINLDMIIGYGKYQPSYKILVNYKSINEIKESRFNECFFGKASDNWNEIEKSIELKLNNKNNN